MRKMNGVGLSKHGALVVWVAAVGILPLLHARPMRADKAADRKALDALYQKGTAGARKGDISFISSLKTADFKRKTLWGQIFNRQQSDRSNRAALARIKKLVSLDVKIVSCQSTGSKAVVISSQRTVMQMEDRQGRIHTVDMKIPGRDIWIKTAGGWRIQYTEDMAPTRMIIDGRQMLVRRTSAPSVPAPHTPPAPHAPVKPVKK